MLVTLAIRKGICARIFTLIRQCILAGLVAIIIGGASAAVLLLQKYGATVSITSQPPSAADASRGVRVLVIADRLSAEQRSSLLAFVGAGGIAIVADPASTLPGGGPFAISYEYAFVAESALARPATVEAPIARSAAAIATTRDDAGIISRARCASRRAHA